MLTLYTPTYYINMEIQVQEVRTYILYVRTYVCVCCSVRCGVCVEVWIISQCLPPVHCLLSAQVRERPDKGVYVKDLSTYVVKSPEHMDKLMLKGAKNSKSLAH